MLIKTGLSIYVCVALALAALTSGLAAQSKNEPTPPTMISVPAPDYPKAAKDAGIGGNVFVLVLIDKKGRPKVVDSYGPMAPCANLDDILSTSIRNAAVEAAKKATFQLATWNGKPIEKGFTLKYKFDANDAGGNALQNMAGASIINGGAKDIPKPKYPSTWGQVGGTVDVSVIVFEDGTVHYAAAISGNRQLRRAAVEAACKATFNPIVYAGEQVKSSGMIRYVFYNYVER